MATKNLSELANDIRIDLDDPNGVFSGDELDRAIEKSVWELSRFIGLEKFYELTLTFTVTAEAWTSGAAAGTYVALGYKPIKWATESVTNAAGAACARDTDYTMDYANGKITHISGGQIGNAEAACAITYTKSQTDIDISSLTDLIRVKEIIYMVGDVPANKPAFELHGNVLTVAALGPDESQSYLTEKKHLVVVYDAYHTQPTASTGGSYPIFLDEVIITLAEAYALFNKAITMEFGANTDLTSARTELGLTTAVHTLIVTALEAAIGTYLGDADTALDAAIVEFGKANAALDKMDNAPSANMTLAVTALGALVTELAADAAFDAALDKTATYLESNTSEDAKFWLTKITTDIAGLRTAFLTAVDAANTYLDEVDTTDFAGAEAVWADEEMHLRENLASGTATSTAAFTITDTGASFTTADEGKLVFNRTDNTWAWVTDYTSSTVLQISHDIIASGEKYTIMFPQAAAMLGMSVKDINAITTGANVPERYVAAAQASIMIAQSWANKRAQWIQLAGSRSAAAMGFVQEASARLQNLQTYLAQAASWMAIAQGFQGEAALRLQAAMARIEEARGRLAIADRWVNEAGVRVANGQGYVAEAQMRVRTCEIYIGEANMQLSRIDKYVGEADRYHQSAQLGLLIADRFRNEAQLKRDEAWSVFRDPKQFVGDFSFSSYRQVGSQSKRL